MFLDSLKAFTNFLNTYAHKIGFYVLNINKLSRNTTDILSIIDSSKISNLNLYLKNLDQILQNLDNINVHNNSRGNNTEKSISYLQNISSNFDTLKKDINKHKKPLWKKFTSFFKKSAQVILTSIEVSSFVLVLGQDIFHTTIFFGSVLLTLAIVNTAITVGKSIYSYTQYNKSKKILTNDEIKIKLNKIKEKTSILLESRIPNIALKRDLEEIHNITRNNINKMDITNQSNVTNEAISTTSQINIHTQSQTPPTTKLQLKGSNKSISQEHNTHK